MQPSKRSPPKLPSKLNVLQEDWSNIEEPTGPSPTSPASPGSPGSPGSAGGSGERKSKRVPTPPHDEMVRELIKATTSHLSELKDMFMRWDADKNGQVDTFEFRKAMRVFKLPGYQDEAAYNDVCDELFGAVDIDGFHGQALHRRGGRGLEVTP